MNLERLDLGQRANDTPLLLGQPIFLRLVAEPVGDRLACGDQQHRQRFAKGRSAVRAGAVHSARSKPRWHAGSDGVWSASPQTLSANHAPSTEISATAQLPQTSTAAFQASVRTTLPIARPCSTASCAATI